MNDRYQALAELLIELESEMRRLQLWTVQSPAAQAFASEAPFCVDSMSFTEWLQYVFLTRMRQLLKEQAPLPEACSIAPFAEEYLKGRSEIRDLITVLQSLDVLLSG